ncbi:MAG: TolC family protein, partial [SAR324 cluster bacterium]|nr:TolC family protein [SAR324 cluster bacterium]
LSILLGIAPAELGDLLSGKPGIPSAPLQVAVSIPADLIRRRPDIRQAEYIAAAQSALIGATEADFYPSFSLSGNFGFLSVEQNGSSLNDLFKWGSRSGSVGPSFRWNILNYGQISNAVRVQDARFEEALVAYQQAVLFAQQEVQNAIVSFSKAIEQVSHLEKAVAAAKRALALIMEEYQSGAADYTTVLTAEQAVLAQEDALMQSRGAVPLALISIYRALGGGWQLREGKEFIPPETKSEMSERTDWGDLLNILPKEEGEESQISVPSSPDW